MGYQEYYRIELVLFSDRGDWHKNPIGREAHFNIGGMRYQMMIQEINISEDLELNSLLKIEMSGIILRMERK